MIDQTLAHFRITAKLGEGGMGEVYRAEDTKLGREVAVKVLPDTVATDPERLARFEREAKVLASLSHPNIAGIHQVEQAEGVHFLVLELAEGEDLAERIERGPVPIEEAVPIALQIAEALEAAHERGIIHRDLKPANIKVDPEGHVKVLDFGLAKALDPAAGDAVSDSAGTGAGGVNLSMSPTLTAQMTGAGVILGTAAYMAPEQAKGKTADKRADIWSFGVVLYEILIGKKLFAAESVAETLGAIFQQEIDLEALPTDTPRRLRRLLERCLERDPKQRLRDIGEARIALREPILDAEPASTDIDSSSVTRSLSIPVLAGVLFIGLLLGAVISFLLQPEPEIERTVIKTEIPTDTLRATRVKPPLISPDGRSVLVPEGDELSIRRLDSFGSQSVPSSAGARYLCWSPDSSSIAFVVGVEIRRASVEGGSPIPVAQMPNDFGGSGGMVWTVTDHLLVAGGDKTGILQVPITGGELREISPLDEENEVDIHEIALLPNGRDLVYVVHRRDPTGEKRLVDSLGVLADGVRKEVYRLQGESLISVVYSPPGYLLFHQTSSTSGVWALPFSADRLEATGEPFLVAADSWLPSTSEDGTLALTQGLTELSSEVVEVDRGGELLRSLTRAQSELEGPHLSPDGSRLAISTPESGNWDLWLHHLDQGTRSRLTFDTTFEGSPRWSPTGDRILYAVIDARQIKIKQVDGASDAITVGEGINADWFSDETGFVFEHFSEESDSWDISYKHFDDDRVVPLLTTAANEVVPRISPDGRFLLYTTDESGSREVMATSFPDAEKRWQVSQEGGLQAQWSPTGREIFFVQGSSLRVVSLTDPESFALTAPEVLVQGATFLSTFDPVHLSPYSPGVDGESIILVRAADDETQTSRLLLIQNWHREFGTAN